MPLRRRAGRRSELYAVGIRLIDRVEVHPPAEGSAGARIELQGHLASMLRLAGAYGPGNAKSPPGVPDGLVMFLGSAKVDAGTGFEPVTFRL